MWLATAPLIGANGTACTQPDTPAMVSAVPMQPPAMLLATDQHGTAELIVTLKPASAQPANVELLQSTGNEILDAAAVEAARKTTFYPETRACVAIGGQYFYEFDY
jgi:TonB family protein